MKPHLDQFCDDLTTQPAVDNKILVTGATGYIGSELVPDLLARGYQVRVMVRTASPEYELRWPGAEVVVADALNLFDLRTALEGIDCAYYMIHSLHLKKTKFKEIDNQVANNFRKAAEENNLKRIIYLGSLGDPDFDLSDHLLSRLMVAEELQRGKTPVTFLKAAVIIGSGSASYKIIKHLIEKCPIILFPKQANSHCQPIAIRDVIKYLVGCLETSETTGKTYDIGGQNIYTYQMMLKIQAKIVGKKRIFIPSFFSNWNVYSRIASLITPVSTNLIKSLMESCSYDVVCQNQKIKKVLPFEPLSYEDALQRALSRESQETLFYDKQKMLAGTNKNNSNQQLLHPPSKSKWILSDIRYFLLHKPEIPTLIKFNTIDDRENYSYRILQRLGTGVTDYRILNVHKIGVNVPVKYVFEELLQWDGDSTCWPNHIAKVYKKDDKLETLNIYLLGLQKFLRISKIFSGLYLKPLFELNAINIERIPDEVSSDNARYMLYESSGGYPIGVFALYVRSSIPDQQEKEQAQLFLMVGFNFYGNEKLSKRKIINKVWEMLHDRVTANVLNRIKQLSEWRFNKIQEG